MEFIFNKEIVLSQCEQIKTSISLIESRMSSIKKAEDFVVSPSGVIILDSICIRLMTIGEIIKSIDKSTQGNLLCQYPEIEWNAIKGMRNLLAHQYFDVDEEEIYKTVLNDLPKLITTIEKIIIDFTTL